MLKLTNHKTPPLQYYWAYHLSSEIPAKKQGKKPEIISAYFHYLRTPIEEYNPVQGGDLLDQCIRQSLTDTFRAGVTLQKRNLLMYEESLPNYVYDTMTAAEQCIPFLVNFNGLRDTYFDQEKPQDLLADRGIKSYPRHFPLLSVILSTDIQASFFPPLMTVEMPSLILNQLIKTITPVECADANSAKQRVRKAIEEERKNEQTNLNQSK